MIKKTRDRSVAKRVGGILSVLFVLTAVSLIGFRKVNAATPCNVDGTSTGVVNVTASVPSSPTSTDNNYAVWLYVRGANNATVGVDIDGGDCIKKTITTSGTGYQWVSMGNDTYLADGNHTLRIVGYADGVYMQKAMLINNSCNPNGASCATEIVQPPTNTPPSVSLAGPSTAQTAPANFKLTASASDSDGISKVEFYKNGVIVATDTVAPYEYQAVSVTAGQYTYTAKAIDANAVPASSTSSPVSVTVNAPAPQNVAPTVSVSSSSTTPTAPATITLTANAVDPDGSVAKVEFFNGATKVGEDTTVPHSLTLTNLAAGTYTYSAKATDNIGASTTSSAVSVTVKNAVPAPTSCTGTNVALNKPATASSDDGNLLANRAVDGSSQAGTSGAQDSRWSSMQGIDPQYLQVNLGTRYKINCVSINWEAAFAADYTIEVADAANGPFKAVQTITGNTSAGVKTHQLTNVEGQFVRVNGTKRATAWGYSIWELGVYGTQSTTTTQDTLPPTGPSTITGASLSYNGWAGACSPSTGCKITLSWPAATDNQGGVGVSHYDVYNGSQRINALPITGTSFEHTGLSGGGSYQYRVFSFDKAGNRSAGSQPLSKTISCTPFLWTAFCGIN